MKILAALALSMMIGGVAQAHQKSTKTIPTIVVDRSGNFVQDLGEYPSEIAEFARQNKCINGGKNARCVYQLPIDGIIAPAFVTVGDMGGEAILLVTEVPARMLDAVQTSFEICEANPRYNSDRVICAGFAWTFNAAGHLVYGTGYYVAESVINLGNAAGTTAEFTTDAIDAVTKGRLDAMATDLVFGYVLMPVCFVGSVVANGIKTVSGWLGLDPGQRANCAIDLRKAREANRKRPKNY